MDTDDVLHLGPECNNPRCNHISCVYIWLERSRFEFLLSIKQASRSEQFGVLIA